ncbi:MAG TPA: NAD(P)/FAD-dependent oxidoreductase [Ktedonobacterales bacterium]
MPATAPSQPSDEITVSAQAAGDQSVYDPARRVVIMGAGPAGLTAAYELMRYQVPSVTLEKDPRFVGGISRTEESRGYRFDIGGHRFFSKSQEVEDFWTEILGEELLTRGRLSRIFYKGKYFDYPLKATNALFNMGPIETVRCISSYAWARVHPTRNPQNLEEWVTNQFGHRLFSIFFKTYTEKVWGISTKELSADWAAQRIKGLNLTEAIKNALFPPKKPKTTSKASKSGKGTGTDRSAVIKTLIDEFRYPKRGPGEMWERVATKLREGGNIVALGQEVLSVRHEGGRVTEVVTRDSASGKTGAVTGAQFISTLPIRELIHRLEPAPPPEVLAAADQLKYRDFLTVALVLNKKDVFPDNWIYIHDPSVKVGRMQNFKSWSPYMVPDQNTTCIGLEYFCFEGDGLWTSTDAQLVALGTQEMAQLGLCQPDEVLWGVVVRQPKAYPVYDDTYKQHLAVIRRWVEATLPNLALVGRNGMHHYNNQDHSMMTALLAARNIATGSHLDPWKVNTDAEYHEEARFEDEDASGRQMPKLANVEK